MNLLQKTQKRVLGRSARASEEIASGLLLQLDTTILKIMVTSLSNDGRNGGFTLKGALEARMAL